MTNEIVKIDQTQEIQAMSMVEGYINTLPIDTAEGKIATTQPFR